MTSEEILGIICPGSPAPGINPCISALTTYAVKLKWKVIGFHDGFLHLSTGDIEKVQENMTILENKDVLNFNKNNGTILRTDRYDPSKFPQKVMNCVRMLTQLKIQYLIIIGGNDQINVANFISSGVDPADMKLIVIPKTVDNDIALPPNQTTLGFNSARSFAIPILRNLIFDAKSAPRWFIVETMGRRSGHLALSICQASGAKFAIIPEDFGRKRIDLSDICDVIEGAILKSLVLGENFGVCLLSEGLINQMSTLSIQQLTEDGTISYNSEGRIVLDNAEISRAVRVEIEKRFSLSNIEIKVANKKVGYEFRSCDPSCFDSVYAQELAYGAIEGFKNDHSNCIVTSQSGVISYLSFRSILDQDTGRVVARRVDVNSEVYKIARSYMQVITKEDLEDEEMVRKLAQVGNSTPEKIVEKYKKVISLLVQ
ncbi:Phosphofructokinase family protein [Tritrichomonas foetus]|uniref:Phosphofructokinase family protein n=1 Tax=Tritrichomonas foetus TaxID=1144522 RepID=A0A1J4KU44_9EUKA|nr:Phosphofructokinase family protein [Tritrichomonas foetus]|eukprot:OHT14801.1 Phosphofructokinase family protein [Tritrichomonas foetus]